MDRDRGVSAAVAQLSFGLQLLWRSQPLCPHFHHYQLSFRYQLFTREQVDTLNEDRILSARDRGLDANDQGFGSGIPDIHGNEHRELLSFPVLISKNIRDTSPAHLGHIIDHQAGGRL